VGGEQPRPRADGLGLDPDAEPHPAIEDAGDQRIEAVGELPLVGPPVPQPAAVVVASGEPAVVDDERLDPQRCRAVGERELLLWTNVERRRVPGVVDDRTVLEADRTRKDGALVVVPSAAQAVGAVRGVVYDWPGSSVITQDSSSTPAATRVRLRNGGTSTRRRQEPLHASATPQAGPSRLSAADTATTGE
jgi:hypothetical protein